MKLLSVNSPAFAPYGKVLDLDLSPLLEALAETPVPQGVVYVASAPELEATATMVRASRAMQRMSSQLMGAHTPTESKLTVWAATAEPSKPMTVM